MNIKITLLSKYEATVHFFQQMKKRGTLMLPPSSLYPYKWFDINSPVQLV